MRDSTAPETTMPLAERRASKRIKARTAQNDALRLLDEALKEEGISHDSDDDARDESDAEEYDDEISKPRAKRFKSKSNAFNRLSHELIAAIIYELDDSKDIGRLIIASRACLQVSRDPVVRATYLAIRYPANELLYELVARPLLCRCTKTIDSVIRRGNLSRYFVQLMSLAKNSNAPGWLSDSYWTKSWGKNLPLSGYVHLITKAVELYGEFSLDTKKADFVFVGDWLDSGAPGWRSQFHLRKVNKAIAKEEGSTEEERLMNRIKSIFVYVLSSSPGSLKFVYIWLSSTYRYMPLARDPCSLKLTDAIIKTNGLLNLVCANGMPLTEDTMDRVLDDIVFAVDCSSASRIERLAKCADSSQHLRLDARYLMTILDDGSYRNRDGKGRNDILRRLENGDDTSMRSLFDFLVNACLDLGVNLQAALAYFMSKIKPDEFNKHAVFILLAFDRFPGLSDLSDVRLLILRSAFAIFGAQAQPEDTIEFTSSPRLLKHEVEAFQDTVVAATLHEWMTMNRINPTQEEAVHISQQLSVPFAVIGQYIADEWPTEYEQIFANTLNSLLVTEHAAHLMSQMLDTFPELQDAFLERVQSLMPAIKKRKHEKPFYFPLCHDLKYERNGRRKKIDWSIFPDADSSIKALDSRGYIRVEMPIGRLISHMEEDNDALQVLLVHACLIQNGEIVQKLLELGVEPSMELFKILKWKGVVPSRRLLASLEHAPYRDTLGETNINASFGNTMVGITYTRPHLIGRAWRTSLSALLPVDWSVAPRSRTAFDFSDAIESALDWAYS